MNRSAAAYLAVFSQGRSQFGDLVMPRMVVSSLGPELLDLRVRGDDAIEYVSGEGDKIVWKRRDGLFRPIDAVGGRSAWLLSGNQSGRSNTRVSGPARGLAMPRDRGQSLADDVSALIGFGLVEVVRKVGSVIIVEGARSPGAQLRPPSLHLVCSGILTWVSLLTRRFRCSLRCAPGRLVLGIGRMPSWVGPGGCPIGEGWASWWWAGSTAGKYRNGGLRLLAAATGRTRGELRRESRSWVAGFL